MLFSPSAAQSTSRSTWLDRLRTAKGFPDHGVTDLDNFLQNPDTNFPDHQTPLPIPTPPIAPISHPTQGTQFFNIVTDVLHDLFNFGDQCTHSTKFKKSARKQPNPRICSSPNNPTHPNNNAPSEKVTLLRTGDSNSGVEGAKVEIQRDGVERDASLAGFSRTEVTVIDTSYELWKFEKLLYRKKNVWKVRDKKGKSEILRSKKRRKLSGAMEEDQNEGKKWKTDKEGRPDKCQLPFSDMSKSKVDEKGQNHGGEKNERESKVEDGSSSVILIKSIHNGKKKQRQQSTS